MPSSIGAAFASADQKPVSLNFFRICCSCTFSATFSSISHVVNCHEDRLNLLTICCSCTFAATYSSVTCNWKS